MTKLSKSVVSLKLYERVYGWEENGRINGKMAEEFALRENATDYRVALT